MEVWLGPVTANGTGARRSRQLHVKQLGNVHQKSHSSRRCIRQHAATTMSCSSSPRRPRSSRSTLRSQTRFCRVLATAPVGTQSCLNSSVRCLRPRLRACRTEMNEVIRYLLMCAYFTAQRQGPCRCTPGPWWRGLNMEAWQRRASEHSGLPCEMPADRRMCIDIGVAPATREALMPSIALRRASSQTIAETT